MAGNDQAQAVEAETALSEEQVREYLKQHEDFLQRNPDMLDHLHIAHASGSAVSLVEKQVSVLRERNVDMRHRLNSLTANARENDSLYDKTRRLVLALLDAQDIEALYRTFMEAMANEFKVEHASMILFGENADAGDCRIESAASAMVEIGALLKSSKPVCGVLRKEEFAYLFPDAGEVGSAVLMPLAGGGEQVGLVAVGSSDAGRYGSNMGTLFLNHIAEVIVRLLPRLAPVS
jgi:uncharacterized protein YigA (DUF484 family)